MNLIAAFIARLGDDKTQHGVAAVAIATFVFPVCLLFGLEVETAKHVTMGVVTAVAIFKEVRDGRGFGTRDWRDAFATISGGALAVYVLESITKVFL